MRVSRQEGAALRGLAILMIVLHNVVHLLSGIWENEFRFNSENLSVFLEAFPETPTMAFFSFYGWLGVAFFVFLSGYGLAYKYDTGHFKIWAWIKEHYLKLFFLVLPGMLIVFFAFPAFIENPLKTTWRYITEQTLLLNLFDPGAIRPGIYWYMGLALQLYLVFLLLRRLSGRWLVVVALLSAVLLILIPSKVSYLRHNFVGWLPDFIFGILSCRRRDEWMKNFDSPERRGAWAWQICGFAVCLALSFFASLTRFTFMFGGVCFVAAFLCVREYLVRVPGLLWVGGVSAAVYVIHAVVRQFWLDYCPLADSWPPMASALTVLVISFLIAVPYEWYYNWIKRLLRL